MSFEQPRFTELNLDAEIGSYQDDFSDVPVVRAEVPGTEDEDDAPAETP